MKTRTWIVALLTAAVTPVLAGGPAHATGAGEPGAERIAEVTRTARTPLAGYANLRIMPTGGPSYAVIVSGRAWPSAVFTGNMRITFWGQDSWSDDKIWERTASTYGDGSFWNQSIIAGLSLDEDWGQDEIYATVRITDPVYGSTTFKTNVVVGDF